MNPFRPTVDSWPELSRDEWLREAGKEAREIVESAEAGGAIPPICGPGATGTKTRRLRTLFCPWRLSDDWPLPGAAGSLSAQSVAEELLRWEKQPAGWLELTAEADLFHTVATFRACRWLAAHRVTDSVPRLRATITGFQSDSQDSPDDQRLIRATLQALAAILGLADEIAIADDAVRFGFPPEVSAAAIRRRKEALASILADEARLRMVCDPFAGSHFVEALTGRAISDIFRFLPENWGKIDDPSADTGDATPDSGWPGAPPFLRGPYPTMYLGKPWTIRQYAGFSDAGDTNRFFRAALADGQTGLSVAFDLPTHRGYDSDHPRAWADVGKAGVAIDTVTDMAALFDGIPLDRVSVSMTMNGAVLPVLAFFFVAAEEKGISPGQLTGTIQNDILKEYMVRNTYIYPPGPSMRIVADVMAWLAANSPKFNSISVSGYHMHEAGATAPQELAYTIANGLAYLEAGQRAGVDAGRLASRMSFFWAQGMDYMTETAKLRAARGLWCRLLWETGLRDSKALALRCHCQTSGWSLTRQDPINNVIRTTLEAVSAVHGHTQSLHTNSLDEAVALPSDDAARIARLTQRLIESESGIRRAVDPWGGSLEMEVLTAWLATEANELIEEVRKNGGMVEAISRRVPQRNIESAAARRQAQIDSGAERIVGVNHLTATDDFRLEVRTIENQHLFESQKQKLAENRAHRDPAQVEAALQALTQAAADGSGNLLYLSIAAARARATVGEISSALETAFGRYEAATTVTKGIYAGGMKNARDTAEVDALIARARAFQTTRGRRPRLLVAKVGQDGHDRGAKIVAGAFADFGFDVDLSPMFRTPEEVARQAIDDDVHVVGVSTLAGAHLSLVTELLEQLRTNTAGHILVIVGGIVPDHDAETLMAAGVSAVFGPGSRLPDCAAAVLDLLEKTAPR
jgi:methylmalonyl-CoA mutase